MKQLKGGHVQGMPQPYNGIRFSFSVVNGRKIKYVISTRIVTKCFSLYEKNAFLILPLCSAAPFTFEIESTSVYGKNTLSGVFTNFKSFIPMTYKTGLLQAMLFRCFSIYSSYENFHEETVKLKEIFKRNFYPEKFIDRCIKKFLNKLHVPKVVKLTTG